MPDVDQTVARLRGFLDRERDRERLRDLLQHDREVMPGTAGGRALPAAPLAHRARGSSRGGLLPSTSPSPVGTGTPQVHHVTATAVASQDIAAGTTTVEWTDEEDAPTERRGFNTFSTQLAAGSVGDIPIPLTGVLKGILSGEWATYRGCDTVTITLRRDGATVGSPVTYDLGPVTSRHFDGPVDGWNVRQGDSLRVELANDSGETQTLTSAGFVGLIRGTTPLADTSTSPPETAGIAGDTSTTGWDAVIPASTEPGDLLLCGRSFGATSTAPTDVDFEADGWTTLLAEVHPGPSDNFSAFAAWKVAEAGDAGSTLPSFSLSGGSFTDGPTFAIRIPAAELDEIGDPEYTSSKTGSHTVDSPTLDGNSLGLAIIMVEGGQSGTMESVQGTTVAAALAAVNAGFWVGYCDPETTGTFTFEAQPTSSHSLQAVALPFTVVAT